ncbi:MAG: filamentous hemagglutinin N-terminal domain-containing protein, partial [Planctomycetota bacterium]
MESLRKISRRYYGRQIVACWLASLMLFGLPVQLAMATPTNPDVVAGGATVDQSGNTTTVNMISGEAVINWDSLNTYSSEVLQFLKAQGGFAVLNRVVQGGATQFDGSLFGNQGYIIIVNPQGVVFGPTSIVQAHQFTASTLDISNDDFMNGIYSFAGGGVGEIANYGNISADQVALIGKKVLNAGVIRSPGGYVLMAAGDKVFLGQEGSDVFVEVEAVTVPQDTPIEGLGNVINEGTIEAAAGQVVLAAGDTFSRAIEGLDTMALAAEGGTGRVGQFGTINVDGVDGDGGTVTLTAGEVVALGSDSLTTANAGTNGDGGDVIVYSPYTALFNSGAWVEAKGGSESGDGGFFELSGKQYVEVWGDVDLSAAAGEAGNMLIDPFNIRITDWGNDPDQGDHSEDDPSAGLSQWTPTNDSYSKLDLDVLEGYLDDFDVTIDNTGTDSATNPEPEGWIRFAQGGSSTPRNLHSGENNDSVHSLTVISAGEIQFGNPSDSDSGVDFAGGGALILDAGTNIISRADTFTVEGDLEMDAPGFIESDSPLISTGGGIDLAADGDIRLRNTFVSAQADGVLRLIADDDGIGGGNLDVDGSLQGNMELYGYNVTVDGTVTSDDTLGVGAENNIQFNDIVSSDDDMLMEAGNNITLNGTAESAISGGLLNLIANEDEIGGGDLYVAGDLYGNMLLVGYDVTVDGMVESADTLEVYAKNNIQLNNTVSSEGDMTMEAGN